MDKLPKTVQWLLDFINLGCVEKKYAPSRFIVRNNIKCLPTKFPSKLDPAETVNPIPFSLFYQAHEDKDGYLWDISAKDCIAWNWSGKKVYYYHNDNEEDELQTPIDYVHPDDYPSNNEPLPSNMSYIEYGDDDFLDGWQPPIYCGHINDYPTLKDIKAFCNDTMVTCNQRPTYRHGFEESHKYNLMEHWKVAFLGVICKFDKKFLLKFYGSNDMLDINDFALDVGSTIMHHYEHKEIPLEGKSSHLENLKTLQNRLEYPHNNRLDQVVYSHVLDFWHNQREYHKILRQCKICGKIFIKKHMVKYCGTKCSDVTSRPERKVAAVKQAEKRDNLLNQELNLAKPEIINHIIKIHNCKEKEAYVIYNGTPVKYKTSLKKFIQNV